MISATPVGGLDLARRIRTIRGLRVMLSGDLAELYGVEPKALNQAVRRNRTRFPADFVLELSDQEARSLRSQSVTLDVGRGRHSKYAPLAFTEQGVAMLSSVLRSERAIQANVAIMRAFVSLRQLMLDRQDLTRRLDSLERKYDARFKVVFVAIKESGGRVPRPPAPPGSRSGPAKPDPALRMIHLCLFGEAGTP